MTIFTFLSSSSKKSNSLNYTVCTSNDIKEAHDHLLPKSFWDGHSEKDLKTMQHVLKTPIWQVCEHTFLRLKVGQTVS